MSPVRDTIIKYTRKAVAGIVLVDINSKTTKYGCDPVKGPIRLKGVIGSPAKAELTSNESATCL